MTTKTHKLKPGRKALAPVTQVGPEFLGKTSDADAKKEIALRAQMEEVVEKFGDGLPYQREHYMAAIRRDMTRTVETVIAIGRRLIVMKTCEGHGNWLGCLRDMGLGEDNAERMMAAARRIDALPNSAPARNLLLASGAPSKLFDLLALPDDELATIAEGDGPIDPEDIEHMTRSELRAALREARADKAALEDRNAKLGKDAEDARTSAAKAKRTWAAATADEQLVQLRRELDAEALQLSIRIVSEDEKVASLRRRVEALIEHGEQNGQDHRVYLAGVFAQIERYLFQVRDEFFIPHLAVGDPALEAKVEISSPLQS